MIDVLVVDDDDAFGELTTERLEEMGWESVFHHGPFGTMKQVLGHRPKVVILDVHMPGLRGTNFLSLIRAEGLEPPPITLLMSSCDEDELKQIAAAEGADAYLTKSVSCDRFLFEMKKLLYQQSVRCGEIML